MRDVSELGKRVGLFGRASDRASSGLLEYEDQEGGVTVVVARLDGKGRGRLSRLEWSAT